MDKESFLKWLEDNNYVFSFIMSVEEEDIEMLEKVLKDKSYCDRDRQLDEKLRSYLRCRKLRIVESK
jgi:hypothetical protein